MNNVFRALKIISKYDIRYLIVKIFVALCNVALSFLSINITKQILDMLVDKQEFSLILACILSLVFIKIFSMLQSLIVNNYYPKLNNKLTHKIQRKLLEYVSKTDYAMFDDQTFYNKMEDASKEIPKLIKVFDCFIEIITNTISLVVVVLTLIFYDWLALLLIIISIIPLSFIKAKINKHKFVSSKEQNSLSRKAFCIRHMLTSKYYAHEVRTFQTYGFLMEKYDDFHEQQYKLTENINKKQASYSFLLSFTTLVIEIIAQINLILKTIKGFFSIGDYSMILSYVSKSVVCINGLMNSAFSLSETNRFLSNLFEFIDYAEENINSNGNEKIKEGKHHTIEFKNVSFAYPNNENKVLKNISFKLEPGSMTMIIGENGAGKSTIIKLLCGFYKDYEGEIFIDDIELRNYDKNELYKFMSIMFQELLVYPLSLEENVSFSKQLKDEDYNDKPWFEEIVKKYPYGIETKILTHMYSNGVEPSGGERQRIMLMRTLYKNDNYVYIFDEPTSSIDPKTEYQIYNSMKEYGKDKITIWISHKLAHSYMADQIINIVNGEIIEKGNHNELINLNGEYSKLYKLQSERYVKNE